MKHLMAGHVFFLIHSEIGTFVLNWTLISWYPMWVLLNRRLMLNPSIKVIMSITGYQKGIKLIRDGI